LEINWWRAPAGFRALLAWLTIFALTNRLGIADEPADTPVLRWGGDQEGGGPYIYPLDDDPTQVIGFEVDLAAALARELHRPAAFFQCTWEDMLLVLSRGKIDLAINGYEYTDQRASRYLASLPYYVYELGLCSRHGNKATDSWAELHETGENGRKKRVGVIEGSAADRYVSDQFGHSCQVLRYPGSTEALQLVEAGQLDATVQDLPILHFYVQHLKRYASLEVVDRPAAPGYYVIYSRPDDARLMSQVNDALRKLYESGELRDIYARYGIWNEKQTELPKVWDSWDTGLREDKQDRWLELGRQVPLLVKAAGVTVALSLTSMPLAIAIGVSVALIRAWGTPALGGGGAAESAMAKLIRLPFTAYVEVIRGTPLAFQLFVFYFILPQFHIVIDEFWSGVLALAVNYSAYEAEIFRLGLSAVPRGQMEAALSLGMPRFLAVRRIILPQAVRLVIPATANDFIALFKDTAVCSVIAVEELSKQYSMGAKSTGLFLEMAALASILYLMMSYPLSLLAGWLERRLRGGDERG
jgi:polar amino acid transport system substrate-binding protein